MTPLRLRAGSRLHLGLLQVPGAGVREGGRSFGGVGLMIEQPGLTVEVRAASSWSSEGPHAERALAVARQSAELTGESRPLAIRVVQAAPEHVGLGTGTQLSLAVATAVRRSLGDNPDPLVVAAEIGRGLRSGIGVHGFCRGGLLVDGGKGSEEHRVAPLVARHDFPEEWSILLATPTTQAGLAGERERAAFAQLESTPTAETGALCRLVLLGMLPALVERDLPAFGEAVFEFNRRAGLLFKASQGGEYGSPEGTSLVRELRGLGIAGVGQSSWGPTIFAIAEPDRIESAASRLRNRHGVMAIVTSARNRGFQIE